MASLGRRLESLESRIIPDRPKLIFILPYVDPSEPLSGLTVALQGKVHTFSGSNMDEMLGRAEAEIRTSNAGLICELVYAHI